jgi:hypothetical protein
MNNEGIEVVFNHDKKRLTILKDGKPVCGYAGNIAIEKFKSIAFGNAKISIEDGQVQPAV